MNVFKTGLCACTQHTPDTCPVCCRTWCRCTPFLGRDLGLLRAIFRAKIDNNLGKANELVKNGIILKKKKKKEIS